MIKIVFLDRGGTMDVNPKKALEALKALKHANKPLTWDDINLLIDLVILLDRKENLLERIRVKAMQTGWMDELKEALVEELNAPVS
jgi:hypothetical protein